MTIKGTSSDSSGFSEISKTPDSIKDVAPKRGRSGTVESKGRRYSVGFAESKEKKTLAASFYSPEESAKGGLREIENVKIVTGNEEKALAQEYFKAVMKGDKKLSGEITDLMTNDLMKMYAFMFDQYELSKGVLIGRESRENTGITPEQLMKTTAAGIAALKQQPVTTKEVSIGAQFKVGFIKGLKDSTDLYLVLNGDVKSVVARDAAPPQDKKMGEIQTFCKRVLEQAKSKDITSEMKEMATQSLLKMIQTTFNELEAGKSKRLNFSSYGIETQIYATRTETGEYIASVKGSPLGEGSFGDVFNTSLKMSQVAEGVMNKSGYVVKVEKSYVKGAKESILNEQKILSLIGGAPGIQSRPITVLDITGGNQGIGLIMEKYDGDAANIKSKFGERFNQQILDIADRLFEGLEHMEANKIVHGDIKPQNMLKRDVEGRIDLVFSDFGGAAVVDEEFIQFDSAKKEYTSKNLSFTPEFVEFNDYEALAKAFERADEQRRELESKNITTLLSSILSIEKELEDAVTKIYQAGDLKATALSLCCMCGAGKSGNFDEVVGFGKDDLKAMVPSEFMNMLDKCLDADYTKRPKPAEFRALISKLKNSG